MKKTDYHRVLGRIQSFDAWTRRGEVALTGRGEFLRFSSTCFYAGRFSRDPRRDEEVSVALAKDVAEATSDDVLGVWVHAR